MIVWAVAHARRRPGYQGTRVLGRQAGRRSRTSKVPGLSRRCLFLTLGRVFLGVVIQNLVAWRHACQFTHSVEGGSRTEGPDAPTMEKARILVDGVRVTHPRVDRSPSAGPIELEWPLEPCDSTGLRRWSGLLDDFELDT